MAVRLHPHARQRMVERGTTAAEVKATVEQGEQFTAKYGRMGFRRNFQFDGMWRGKQYRTKQVEAYAVKEGRGWLVVTAMTKYF